MEHAAVLSPPPTRAIVQIPTMESRVATPIPVHILDQIEMSDAKPEIKTLAREYGNRDGDTKFSSEGREYTVGPDGSIATRWTDDEQCRCALVINAEGLSFTKHASPDADLPDDVFEALVSHHDFENVDMLEELGYQY
jgi:hypothetical protein